MPRRKVAHDRIERPRIVTTDAEIDRAIERAKRSRPGPLVTAVDYKPGPDLDMIILKLSDGRRRMIPREDLQGLESGTTEQLSRIGIVGGGTGLHWPELDADLYVPGLLRGIYGSKQWMARLGQIGGQSRSRAKKAAARANGLKGGRPRQTVAAAGD